MPNDTLLQVVGSSYAWSGKYAVGAYLHKETREAYLIDSGPNQKTAELLDREITNKGFKIAAIIHTHGHMVNTGGSAYFKKRYPKLRCYASQLTTPIMNNPSLLAHQSPISQLLHIDKDEAGSPGSTPVITDTIPFQDGVLEINGISFTVHALPGHFLGMIGIQTPDKVLYCADALFGSSTLSKQRLLYFTEPDEAKKTMEKLRKIQAAQYVLYHGGVYKGISELIEENLSRMDDVYHDVLRLAEQKWQTIESITQRVISKYELENTEKQYELAYIITQSYAKLLLKEGKISRIIKNGILYFETHTNELA